MHVRKESEENDEKQDNDVVTQIVFHGLACRALETAGFHTGLFLGGETAFWATFTRTFSPVNTLFFKQLYFPFTRKRKPETHRFENIFKSGYPG